MEPPTLSGSGAEKETGSHLESLPASKGGDGSGMGMNLPPDMWVKPTSEGTHSPQKVSGPVLSGSLPAGSLQEGRAGDVTSVPPNAAVYNPAVGGGASMEACPDVQQLVSETAGDGNSSWTGGSVDGEQIGNWEQQTGSGGEDQIGNGDQDARIVTQTGSGDGDQTGTGDGEQSGSEYPTRGDGELTQPMETTGSGCVEQIGNMDIAQIGSGTMEQTGSDDMECTETVSTENRAEMSDVKQDTGIEAEQLTGNGNEESGSGNAACAAPEVQQEPEGDETVKGWEGEGQ